jgi:hypothetical protein
MKETPCPTCSTSGSIFENVGSDKRNPEYRSVTCDRCSGHGFIFVGYKNHFPSLITDAARKLARVVDDAEKKFRIKN